MAFADASALLPPGVTPSHYTVALTVDLVACRFTGTAAIDVSVAAGGADSITLHAHTLSVEGVSFTGADGVSMPATTLSFDLGLQRLTATFASRLPAGKGVFACSFAGALNDDLAGLYRSKYTLRGESRWMAVTQVRVFVK